MYQCTKMYIRCTGKTNIFDDSPSRPNIICFFPCSPGSAVVYPVDNIYFNWRCILKILSPLPWFEADKLY